jgi:hypothetical protein
MIDSKTNPKQLPVIATARTAKEINKAAKIGYYPLIKQVKPSSKIRGKYAVYQHKETGEIFEVGDFRENYNVDNEYRKVIDWTWYYPYTFPAPYAAYIVPENLQPGDIVWLEDLIEDYVGSYWNQGNTTRLKSAEAVWNGEDFEVKYDPSQDVSMLVG